MRLARTMHKIDTLLTTAFMLLALAAVVLYFAVPQERIWFFAAGGAAILLRAGQYIWRLVRPHARRRSRPLDRY